MTEATSVTGRVFGWAGGNARPASFNERQLSLSSRSRYRLNGRARQPEERAELTCGHGASSRSRQGSSRRRRWRISQTRAAPARAVPAPPPMRNVSHDCPRKGPRIPYPRCHGSAARIGIAATASTPCTSGRWDARAGHPGIIMLMSAMGVHRFIVFIVSCISRLDSPLRDPLRVLTRLSGPIAPSVHRLSPGEQRRGNSSQRSCPGGPSNSRREPPLGIRLQHGLRTEFLARRCWRWSPDRAIGPIEGSSNCRMGNGERRSGGCSIPLRLSACDNRPVVRA